MASAPRPLQVDALEQQQWVIAQLPNGNGRPENLGGGDRHHFRSLSALWLRILLSR
jgi:hypothetical protein